ncbi:MAG TPA: hypothetical protein VGE10_04055 [Zeimonas sp.]
MNARIRSSLRRTTVAACALALATLLAAQASAQPYGRMDPDQRERFRRELRQHDAQRGERAQRAQRGGADEARRRAPSAPEGGRLSRDERERLRQQLREARPEQFRRNGRR